MNSGEPIFPVNAFDAVARHALALATVVFCCAPSPLFLGESWHIPLEQIAPCRYHGNWADPSCCSLCFLRVAPARCKSIVIFVIVNLPVDNLFNLS